MQPIPRLFSLCCAVLIGLLFSCYLGGSPVKAQVVNMAPTNFDCAAVTEIPQIECQALVALYNSAGGPQWGYQDWLGTVTPCSWRGVTCDQQHVIKLEIRPYEIEGILPLELSNLTNLQVLDLGCVPVFIFSCNRKGIKLIPEVGNLKNLRRLILTHNRLNSFLSEFGKLTNLQFLDLSYNELTSIPVDVGKLINLQDLTLNVNNLASIPTELGNLTNLQTLSLDHNNLSDVPVELGKLTKLTKLTLGSNHLSKIPAELGNLTELQILLLEFNQLTNIPTELGNLINLKWLTLEINQLTSLPVELGKLNNLQVIDLDHNRLTSLPPQLGDLTNLQSLRVNDNQLASLPVELGNLTSLQAFFVAGNQLTSLPAELGRLINLQVFIAASNQLTSIPVELGKLANLQELDLSANELTSIPAELGSLSKLEIFYLNVNLQLKGSLPQTFIKLKLSSFGFGYTGLCEPANDAFQVWLTQIYLLGRTNITCLKLTPNFATGAPGSQFTLIGSEFPTNTVTLSVNGVTLGTLQPDASGQFTVTLSSTLATPGSYIVTADMGIRTSTHFMLSLDAPLHPPVGDSTFALPAGIAYITDLFFPIAAR